MRAVEILPDSAADVARRFSDGGYLSANPSWHVEDAPWKAAQISALMRRHDLNPASLCDVGCGAGEIARLLALEWPQMSVTGFEPSPQAFALCQPKAGPRLAFVQADARADPRRFDTLICIDVFEHIEDCFGFVRALKDKARNKIFHIPLDLSVVSVLRETMMVRRREVGHLHHFSKQTALALLADCGLEVVEAVLTRGFDGIPAPSWKARLARLPRRALCAVSPEWGHKLLGGCSLLVLAR
jgi:SAM-dependent methyltransferase